MGTEATTSETTLETKTTESNASESQIKELKEKYELSLKESGELKKTLESNNTLLEVLKKKGLLGDDGKPTDKDDKYELIRKESDEKTKKYEELLKKTEEQEKKLNLMERNDKIRDWAKNNSKEGKAYSPNLIIGLMKDGIPDDLPKAIKELEKEFPEIMKSEKDVGPRLDDSDPAKKKGNQGDAAVKKAIEGAEKDRNFFKDGLDKLIQTGRA